jgi:hypothetical protein
LAELIHGFPHRKFYLNRAVHFKEGKEQPVLDQAGSIWKELAEKR